MHCGNGEYGGACVGLELESGMTTRGAVVSREVSRMTYHSSDHLNRSSPPRES